MDITNKDLKRRIIEISWKHKLSHLGSCLTAVDIIEEIFAIKKPGERFVLDAGHSALGLYAVLEEKTGKNAEDIFKYHGVHPDYCRECGLDCSTGSLGQGISISVGMALADRKKNCYVLMSDGGSNEGSFYEAMRIADEQKLSNLQVYINCNGYGAYKEIDRDKLIDRCRGFQDVNITFRKTNSDQLPFLKEMDAHYYTMTEEDYKQAMEILK